MLGSRYKPDLSEEGERLTRGKMPTLETTDQGAPEELDGWGGHDYGRALESFPGPSGQLSV